MALGAVIPVPFWALVIVVIVAHVALDLLPHWDYTRTRHPIAYGALDFGASLLTLAIGWLVFRAPASLLVLGAISAAPDCDVLISAASGRQGNGWFPSHWRRFPHGECKPLPGILVQVLVVALSCAALALSSGA
jgi:hypothetical protein